MRSEIMRITRHLFTLRAAMVAALSLALFAQLEHTAFVARHLSRNDGGSSQISGLTFALAVEFSVLLFVLAGHKWISYLFAVATFLTNLSYYWVALNGNFASADAAFAVLFALLLPGVIVGYSHSVAAKRDNQVVKTESADGNLSRQDVSLESADGKQGDNLVTEGTEVAQQVVKPVVNGRKRVKQGDKQVNMVPVSLQELVALGNQELSNRVGVSRQSVGKWRKDGTLEVKLTEKLPELTTVHVNGNGHNGAGYHVNGYTADA